MTRGGLGGSARGLLGAVAFLTRVPVPADGLGGGRTRDDVLRSMRHHAVGAYGAIALVIILLVKGAAFFALVGTPRALPVVIAAGALSRWAVLPLAAALPYARPTGGLGATLAGRLRWSQVAVAAALAAAVLAASGLSALRAACAFAVVALTVALAGWWFQRRVGGVTGDLLGAVGEVTDAAVLLIGVALP